MVSHLTRVVAIANCLSEWITEYEIVLIFASFQVAMPLFQCNPCGLYFESVRALQNHGKTSPRHVVDYGRRCLQCGSVYSSPASLIHHYVESPVHYYCSHCDEHFERDSDYRSHKFSRHNGSDTVRDVSVLPYFPTHNAVGLQQCQQPCLAGCNLVLYRMQYGFPKQERSLYTLEIDNARHPAIHVPRE